MTGFGRKFFIWSELRDWETFSDEVLCGYDNGGFHWLWDQPDGEGMSFLGWIPTGWRSCSLK